MFRRLRAENPVSWHEFPAGRGFWNVVKHADLVEVNRDPETYSSEIGGTNMFDIGDRPVKTAAVRQPRHPDARHGSAQAHPLPQAGQQGLHAAHDRPDRAAPAAPRQHDRRRRDRNGQLDFVEELAAELPLQAIAEIMGVPQEDRHMLFEWSNRMIGSDDPEYARRRPGARRSSSSTPTPTSSPRKRKDDPRDDIVTKLINAEIDGDKLSEVEFDMFMLLLAVAGNETTRNTTAHGMLALMRHPDAYQALLADPALLPTAIEEMLRWATPVLHFRRTATRDTEIRGQQIKKGEKVVMWHISANRDEEVFDDPYVFDITAPERARGVRRRRRPLLPRRQPRPHGAAAHLQEILERMPDMQLADEPQMLRSNFIGGIKHMPVTFTPAARKNAA